MPVKAQEERVQEAFTPPTTTRLAEGLSGVRAVLRALPTPTALFALARTVARVGPLRARLRAGSPPLTGELSAVEQAIVWSIALHASLLELVPAGQAHALTDRVIVDAGVRLMARAFPRLSPGGDPLQQLADFVLPALRYAERHGLYRLGQDERRPAELIVRITYCHYAACCQAAGVPRLARSYCNVDVPFFTGLDRRVRFACPGRISDGDGACTFVFSLAGGSERLP